MDPSLLVALGLWTADFGQTRYIVEHEQQAQRQIQALQAEGPAGRQRQVDRDFEFRYGPSYSELNPMLGRRPSMGRVDLYFAAGAAGLVAAHYQLPKPWGDVVTYAVIGTESIVVSRNVVFGIGWHF